MHMKVIAALAIALALLVVGAQAADGDADPQTVDGQTVLVDPVEDLDGDGEADVDG